MVMKGRAFSLPLAALEFHTLGRVLVVVRVVVGYAPFALLEEHVGIISSCSLVIVVSSSVSLIVSRHIIRDRLHRIDRYCRYWRCVDALLPKLKIVALALEA